MKTFNTFKEDLKQSLSPLKQFGQNFAKEAENFANSKEAENLKNDVINFFLDKGQEALNQGDAKIKNIRKNLK